jgi:hypothetical protein
MIFGIQLPMFDAGIPGPDGTSGSTGPVSHGAAPAAGTRGPDGTSGTSGPVAVQRHEWHRLSHRPVVAFDWSIKAVDVTEDGKNTRRYPSVDTLIVDLADRRRSACRVVCESSVSSYPAGERNATIRKFTAAGHTLFFIPPKLTSRYRGHDPRPGDTTPRRPDPKDRWALNGVSPTGKTDAGDALAIWAVACGPTVPYRAKRDDDDASATKVARRNLIRYAFWAEQREGRTGDLAAHCKRKLRGNTFGLSDSTLAAVYFIAMHTDSRDEFEALLGLSAAGYPSILRAYIHTNEGRERAADLSTWRRQIRQARRALLNAGHGRSTPWPPAGTDTLQLDLPATWGAAA